MNDSCIPELNQTVDPRTTLIKYRKDDKIVMSPFETAHKIMDLGHHHWWLKIPQ